MKKLIRSGDDIMIVTTVIPEYYIIDELGCNELDIDISPFVNTVSELLPDPIDPNECECEILSFISDKEIESEAMDELHNMKIISDKKYDFTNAYLIFAKRPYEGYEYFYLKLEYFYIRIPESDPDAFWYNDPWRYRLFNPKQQYIQLHDFRIDVRDLFNTKNRKASDITSLPPKIIELIRKKNGCGKYKSK